MKKNSISLVLILVLALVLTGSVSAMPFQLSAGGSVAAKNSYQGRLAGPNGQPMNGTINLVFQLWDSPTAGGQIGGDIIRNSVKVNDGLFTAILDVPHDAFYGRAIWLQIKVNGQALSPRQELLPAPYALSLRPGAVISGPGPNTLTLQNQDGGRGLGAWSTNNIGLLGTSGAVDSTAVGMHGVHGVGEGVGVYGEGGITGTYGKGTSQGVMGESANGDGVIGTTQAATKSGVYGWSNTGIGVTGRSNGNNHGIFGATFSTQSEHAGVLGRNNGTGAGVRGEATSTTVNMNYGGYFVSNGLEGRGVFGEAKGGSGIGIYGKGKTGVMAEATPGGDALLAVVNQGYGVAIVAKAGPDGGHAAQFYGNIVVRSRAGEDLVELGEGLDYAEGFDVSDPAEITPGMVLIIDQDQPGQLKLSDQPYDHKVAGVVAGANGMGSAVRLAPGQFDFDVALAGRMYGYVDATYGAIEPGDLLTTSPTPGYAMLASDYDRSQGAILGKAMEALPEGEKGLILILVTLQ